MAAATHTIDAPTSGGQRDDGLWHVFIDMAPDRGLCGRELHGEAIPFDVEADGGECVVCHDLAERYIDGTWSP